VTRCAVSLPDGVVGVAYVQGRSADHAKRAAMLDGLLQIPRWHARIQQQVIAPLDRTRQDAADHASRKAAQTKVEFFTLVRGEN
jgi:alpha-D-ribose 1-methylphosphonate 5-triphosphate synthase subunit PhnG